MKYAHTDTNGQIIGWYDTEVHATIPTPNISVSDEVWLSVLDNKHNKVNADGTTELVDFRTNVEKAEDIRTTRNLLLQQEVDPIVTNPLRWAELSTEQQQAWSVYRKALLDVPEQSGFPDNVVWPVSPTAGV